jgi:hypothetical protein
MSEGVFWDGRKQQWMIQVVLDPEEARNIAYALGLSDTGAKQLLAWADEAEGMPS